MVAPSDQSPCQRKLPWYHKRRKLLGHLSARLHRALSWRVELYKYYELPSAYVPVSASKWRSSAACWGQVATCQAAAARFSGRVVCLQTNQFCWMPACMLRPSLGRVTGTRLNSPVSPSQLFRFRLQPEHMIMAAFATPCAAQAAGRQVPAMPGCACSAAAVRQRPFLAGRSLQSQRLVIQPRTAPTQRQATCSFPTCEIALLCKL